MCITCGDVDMKTKSLSSGEIDLRFKIIVLLLDLGQLVCEWLVGNVGGQYRCLEEG